MPHNYMLTIVNKRTSADTMIYIWTNTCVGSSETVESEEGTPNETQDANSGNANMQSAVDY